VDFFEINYGFDPLTPGEQLLDSDGDGLDNLAEQAQGTSPLDDDTDNDGVLDSAEVAQGTDPTDGSDYALPIATDDLAVVDRDAFATSVGVLANDSDPDGSGGFMIDSVTQPANGTVLIYGEGSGLTYRPDPGYMNDGLTTDDFTYTLRPGGSTATVRVTVLMGEPRPVPGLTTLGGALLASAIGAAGGLCLRRRKQGPVTGSPRDLT
jgi:hypothetical protein